jgi:hypothetical protein
VRTRLHVFTAEKAALFNRGARLPELHHGRLAALRETLAAKREKGIFMVLTTALTFLATVLAVRLVARIVRRARSGEGGCGRGGGRFGFGRNRALRWLFRALDTTPGQEKVIRQALEEAWVEAREARAQAREQRGNLAAAIRGEGADAASFTQAREGAKVAYDRAEAAVVSAFRRIHEALDPMQRERLARIVDGGGSPFGGFGPFGKGGGPYRSPVAL